MRLHFKKGAGEEMSGAVAKLSLSNGTEGAESGGKEAEEGEEEEDGQDEPK